ncbi:putative serine/threonine-protein kinase-like protein CCR3 [Ricinus communis]|uniref:putative serine/threonine-protein kinase-like protein CCR3 n=1 Tax=Ricinus communis TaxID=3988 RepID=UPI00201A6643|nr:putative serine/threonine-protein kinase-like protein CCR3 [Ricinus communis]
MARVSDFGPSLIGPEYEILCIDPEFNRILNAKSDVYSFGVVLLVLLTGKAAIFEDIDSRRGLIDIASFAVPKILSNELFMVLDPRVGPPEQTGNEAEAVDLVAKTAVCCMNLEGKNRPTMSDIAANLKQSFSLCDGWLLRIIDIEAGK